MSAISFWIGLLSGFSYSIVVMVVVQVKYKEYLDKQTTIRKLIRKKII